MARAAAHGTVGDVRFSDPVAIDLLPERARRQVERFRNGPGTGVLSRLRRTFFTVRSRLMAARTVAIDDAIREAGHPQVVLLGAGLDGRAWRMPELADAVVFEVDHPDTQREKRLRAEALAPVAREVRFVPVDFERQDLDDELAAARHDPTRPTTWVWEGVVMYLGKRDVESTLRIIERRSAPSSRLVVAYFGPSLLVKVVGVLVRLMGEPVKSVFTVTQMAALLRKHGFEPRFDRGLPEIGRSLSEEIGRATKRLEHMRIVTADRTGAATS
jgi:methyltransferase (TIGR00027 family)